MMIYLVPKVALYCWRSPQICAHSSAVLAHRHRKVCPVFQSAIGIWIVATWLRITLINPNEPVTKQFQRDKKKHRFMNKYSVDNQPGELFITDPVPVKSIWLITDQYAWPYVDVPPPTIGIVSAHALPQTENSNLLNILCLQIY